MDGSPTLITRQVAYVPAFHEDRSTFVKERANGLYGPASFMIANFLIGLPYLCKLRCLSYSKRIANMAQSIDQPYAIDDLASSECVID